jgi:hypothetical protein
MTQSTLKVPQKPSPAEPKKNTTPAAAKPARTPTHDEISSRARTLWEAKGHPAGRDEEIWLEAEAQLRKGPA